MSELIYSAVIELKPITKKNHQEIRFRKSNSIFCYYKRTERGIKSMGIPFIAQNKKYEQYEAEAGWFLRRPADGPIDKPVNVKVLFYCDSKRRVDLTNLLEAIDDVLVKHRVLADDNYTIVCSHDGSRFFIDKENPRTEIYIERFVE